MTQKLLKLKKKLTDHNHDKYITTPVYKKFIAKVFDSRLAQANVVTKTDFDTTLISLNKKIISNETKHLLVKNELKKTKNI